MDNDRVLTKAQKKEIAKLKSEKEYEKLYEIYGSEVYKYNVPSMYKLKEKSRLYDNAEYDKLWKKYGKREFIELTEYKNKTMMQKLKTIFTRKFMPALMSSALLLPTSGVKLVSTGVELQSRKELTQNYLNDKEKYEERMKPYVENLKNAELTDLELIVKVIDDMWGDIDGYLLSEDLWLYGRLNFAEENGTGVCRNMADHLTYILNEVNPNYNARNYMTYVDFGNAQMNLMEIERNFPENPEENNQAEPDDHEETVDISPETMGNHAVTLLQVPKQGYMLVVDSTNPSIGILENNSIHVFDNDELYTKGAYGSNLILRGFFGLELTVNEIVKSHMLKEQNIEELERIWGLSAQNEALEEVRSKKIPGIQESYEASIINGDVEFKEQLKHQVTNGEVVSELESTNRGNDNIER